MDSTYSYLKLYTSSDISNRDPGGMNTRNPADGKVYPNLNGHIVRPQLIARTDEEKKQIFNAGGHGCFAKPSEYVQIIACLLNDGKHAKTGHQLLMKETVDEMFKNQIPEFPDYGRQVSDPLSPLVLGFAVAGTPLRWSSSLFAC